MTKPIAEMTREQKIFLVHNIKKLRKYGYSDTQIITFLKKKSRQIISAIVCKGVEYSIKYEKAVSYNILLCEAIKNYESTRKTEKN